MIPLRVRRFLFILSCLFLLAGVAQMVWARLPASTVEPVTPQTHGALLSNTVASMDSSAFAWSEGWRVNALGADPGEPASPESMPSGTLRFSYVGSELALLLGVGDYWGYLYVTVDGAPANLLPASRAHAPPPAEPAGYKPLYAPEASVEGAPVGQWVRVHRATDAAATHEVIVEVWRSWGQTPLRAVAVDALPPPARPLWPGVALVLAGVWLAAPWLLQVMRRAALFVGSLGVMRAFGRLLTNARARAIATWLGAAGALIVATGVYLDSWLVCAPGLALLALAGLVRPAIWYAALFFALPFYYRFALPLLPGRAINLVDVGAWLGLALVGAHLLGVKQADVAARASGRSATLSWALLLLAALACWSLVSSMDAHYMGIALREWRTVFLAALLIASGLTLLLRHTVRPHADLFLIIGGWLAGAGVLAALALLLYPDASVIIPAEGVQRLRGFYGSPNNLALYLGRTLAMTLALALFAPARWRVVRIGAAGAALLQVAAFVLTFSKGGLFVALPALGITLWVMGIYSLRRQGRSARILWLLAGVAALVALALLPFLGTERFASIVDLRSGTGFLRVNLWRSAWQMALDHPLLGVGPDQFLYAYRSGYLLPQAWMEPNLNHPHNWLLDWWTRLGIPGLVLGMAFWWAIVWGAWQNLWQATLTSDPSPTGEGGLHLTPGPSPTGEGGIAWQAIQTGVLAATVAALAHGLVDLSYALPDLMAIWALFAVLTSAWWRDRDTEKAETAEKAGS